VGLPERGGAGQAHSQQRALHDCWRTLRLEMATTLKVPMCTMAPGSRPAARPPVGLGLDPGAARTVASHNGNGSPLRGA